jgi:hypothetical protein
MTTAAAAAVSDAATIRHNPHGTLLPDRAQLADTATAVASAVARAAVDDAVAPALTNDQINQAIQPNPVASPLSVLSTSVLNDQRDPLPGTRHTRASSRTLPRDIAIFTGQQEVPVHRAVQRVRLLRRPDGLQDIWGRLGPRRHPGILRRLFDDRHFRARLPFVALSIRPPGPRVV